MRLTNLHFQDRPPIPATKRSAIRRSRSRAFRTRTDCHGEPRATRGAFAVAGGAALWNNRRGFLEVTSFLTRSRMRFMAFPLGHDAGRTFEVPWTQGTVRLPGTHQLAEMAAVVRPHLVQHLQVDVGRAGETTPSSNTPASSKCSSVNMRRSETCCSLVTTRSRTAGIPNGRLAPSALGMQVKQGRKSLRPKGDAVRRALHPAPYAAGHARRRARR